jgi:hypothetical protein
VACDQVTTQWYTQKSTGELLPNLSNMALVLIRHVFPPTVKICNKIAIDIPHTCA